MAEKTAKKNLRGYFFATPCTVQKRVSYGQISSSQCLVLSFLFFAMATLCYRATKMFHPM